MKLVFDQDFLMKEFLPSLLNWLLATLMFVVSKIFDVLVPPFERQFSLKDVSISYPHDEKETVNNAWLWLCSLIFPAFVIILLNFPKFNLREIHRAILGLFFSTALAYLITHITKNLVGRLRPDFLDRCVPSSDKPIDEEPFYRLANGATCTSTNEKLVRAGRQSFFSGHTSTAFSGLGYLSLYISLVFTIWKKPGNIYKTWLAVIPLLIALFIGLSRIANYRHHWEDVLVGMIVGYSCAYFCFKQSLLFDYIKLSTDEQNLIHDSYTGESSLENI